MAYMRLTIAAVTDTAKAWFFLSKFRPMSSMLCMHLLSRSFSLSNTTKTVPSSSQTPTLDATAMQIQVATRAEHDLRAAVSTSPFFVLLSQPYKQSGCRTRAMPLPKILILLVRRTSLSRVGKHPHWPEGVCMPRTSSHFRSTNLTKTKTS